MYKIKKRLSLIMSVIIFATTFNLGSIEKSYAATPTPTARIGDKDLSDTKEVEAKDIYNGDNAKDITIDFGAKLYIKDGTNAIEVNKDTKTQAQVLTVLRNSIKLYDTSSSDEVLEFSFDAGDITIDNTGSVKLTITNLTSTKIPKDRKLALQVDGKGLYTNEGVTNVYGGKESNGTTKYLLNTWSNKVDILLENNPATTVNIKKMQEKGLVVRLSKLEDDLVSIKGVNDANTTNTKFFLENLVNNVFTFEGATVNLSGDIGDYFDITSTDGTKDITIKAKFWQEYPNITALTVNQNSLKSGLGDSTFPANDIRTNIVRGVTAEVQVQEFKDGSYSNSDNKAMTVNGEKPSFVDVNPAGDIVITFNESIEPNIAGAKLKDIITVNDGDFATLFDDAAFPAAGPTTPLTLKPKSLAYGTNYDIAINTKKLKATSPSSVIDEGTFTFKISTKAQSKVESAKVDGKKIFVTFSEPLNTGQDKVTIERDNQGTFESYTKSFSYDPSTQKKIISVDVEDEFIKEKYKIYVNTGTSTGVTTEVGEVAPFTAEVEYNRQNKDVVDFVTLIDENYKEYKVDKDKITDKIPTKLKFIILNYKEPNKYNGASTNTATINDNDVTISGVEEYKDKFTGYIIGVKLNPSGTDFELQPDKEYTITVDKSKINYNANPAGYGEEKFTFKTVSAPTGKANNVYIEQGTEQDGVIALTFTEAVDYIETLDNNDSAITIMLGADTITVKKGKDYATAGEAYVSKKTDEEYQIIIPKDTINDPSTKPGEYFVKVPDGVFRKTGTEADDMKVSSFTSKLSVTKSTSNFIKKLTIETFGSDNLITTTRDSIRVNSNNIEINEVYINTDMVIEFGEEVKSSSSIDDLFTLQSFENLKMSDYFDVDINISNPFTQLTLKNKKGLEPNQKYKLILNNKYLTYDASGTHVGDSTVVIPISTEKKPVIKSYKVDGRDIIINFDRKIDLPTFDRAKPFLKEMGPFADSKNDFDKFDIIDLDGKINLTPNPMTLILKDLEYNHYIAVINKLDEVSNLDFRTITRKTQKTGETRLYAEQSDLMHFDIAAPELLSKNIVLDRFTGEVIADTVLVQTRASNKGKDTDISLTSPIKVYYNQVFKIEGYPDEKNPEKELKAINQAFSLVGTSLTTTTEDSIKFSKAENLPKGEHGILLTPERPFEPGRTYTFTLNKYSFFFTDTDRAGKAGETEEYSFTAETAPRYEKPNNKTIEQKLSNQSLTIQMTGPIDIRDASGISIDGVPVKPEDVTADGNVLSVRVSPALAQSLSIGKHTLEVGDGALMRKGANPSSDVLKVDGFKVEFDVIEDREITAKKEAEEAAKKAEEEAKKKKEEEEKARKEQERKDKEAANEAFKNAIADKLAEEIEKRYQAEYGSDYDFLSLNDYIRKEYYDKYDKDYGGDDFIQAMLKENGYVDDYIAKYGRDLDYVEDYMNRYGAFAYFDESAYDNPFFTRPFDQPSNKKDYYDYYNYYDYGYRFPTMREGEDMKSQATFEAEERLKAKERELYSIQEQNQRGQRINNNSYTLPLNTSLRRIEIKIGSSYATEYDSNGTSRQINMGVDAYVQNGRTMVPVSEIAKAMGVFVNYDAYTGNTTLSKPGVTAVFNVNTSYIYVNGVAENMGLRPQIRNSRTLVPIHYMAKAFGLENGRDVIYNRNTDTITIQNY